MMESRKTYGEQEDMMESRKTYDGEQRRRMMESKEDL